MLCCAPGQACHWVPLVYLLIPPVISSSVGFMMHLLGFSTKSFIETGAVFGGIGSILCSSHGVSGLALKELSRQKDPVDLC